MTFVPLRLRGRQDGTVLCTADNGTFFRALPSFGERLARDQLTDADRQFLDQHGLLVEVNSGLPWEVLACGIAERLTIARRIDYLILVPTLRCNLSCDYCQVSRVPEHRPGFDWDEETVEAVLSFIDQLATPTIKIEFQGGEPTLRPDILKAVIERCARFEHAEFVICTNLQDVNSEVLALFDRDDVFISTSLDGDPKMHQRHRTGSEKRTRQFLANLDWLTARYGGGKISALPTIDPENPPEPDDLISAFTSFGIDSIFLRPVNFHGFARKRYKTSITSSENWFAYYEAFVRRLIDRNYRDQTRLLSETYFSICLRRIFRPGADRHMDLRNPNPVGADYLVIDHDGSFYPSDEARMLARSGIIDLAIGDLRNGLDGERIALLNRSASNSFDPDCQACVYQPYCGRDMIDDLARYQTIDVPRLETEFCRKHRHLFDFIFELVYSDDPAVQYSLCRWLGLPGEVALGETWQ